MLLIVFGSQLTRATPSCESRPSATARSKRAEDVFRIDFHRCLKVRHRQSILTIGLHRCGQENEPSSNEFFLASQFWISGDYGKKCADLVGFVNGIPLVFIELKASHKKLELAYEKNLSSYRDTIPQVLWYNAVIILSNGLKARIGSMTAGFEHFSEWKKIDDEKEPGLISLETGHL